MTKKAKNYKNDDCGLCCADPISREQLKKQILSRVDEMTALEDYIKLIKDEIYVLKREFNESFEREKLIKGTCPRCKDARFKETNITPLHVKSCLNCGWIEICKAEVKQ